MYLPRSSRWSMTRRRKRPNYFGWVVFGLVLLFGYYFNQVYLPTQPNPFEPTPTVTRSPESYVTEAEALFKEGKLFQSIEAYKEAVRLSPQDSTLYIALARMQVWAGQYEEAQENAESGLLLSSNNAMAHAVRAWALDFQGGPDNNAEALSSIEQALTIDSQNPLIYAYYAEILVDSNSADNVEKAIEASKKALALDPNLVETRRARGYLLYNTGGADYAINFEEAIVQFQEAIKINKNLAILHMELGDCYRALQVTDKAVQEYTIANTLNPPDPDPEYFISRTLATVGDYAKAVQYAEQAMLDDPTQARLHGNYGVMLYRNLSWAEAVDELRLATNGGRTKDNQDVVGLPLTVNDPRATEYYFTFGLALARTNQCGEALLIFQSLQTRVPSDEIAMEAAAKIIEICQENLDNPAVDTPTPSPVVSPTEETTPTPLPN